MKTLLKQFNNFTIILNFNSDKNYFLVNFYTIFFKNYAKKSQNLDSPLKLNLGV